MSEIEVDAHPEFIQKLEHLKLKLQQARLAQRDTSLKSTRELKVLKRVIANLGNACVGYHEKLDQEVTSIQKSLEQKHDISKLIPKLAILERALKENTRKMETEKSHLDERIKNSGETLQRVPGLPAQLKRDLRNLLSFPSSRSSSQLDQAIRLLGIYENAMKIITSNSAHSLAHDGEFNSELLNKISEQLQSLITEIDFDGESGFLLSDIRIKLLDGVSAEALLELTIQVLKLVIEGTHFERKTSEKFLGQVTGSLTQVIGGNVKNIEQADSYSGHRAQMANELHSLSQESQAALDKAPELEAARSALNPLLEQINMLSERLQHNEQREQMLLERMKHNQRQLESLQELAQNHKRRLDEQSKRLLQDPLTNVFNRTAFIEKLEVEYHKWIRTQHPLHLMLIDIDSFKSLNDSFGYTAGDKALKIIARTISKELGEKDIIARFSGEEFILILPESGENGVRSLSEKLQLQISKLPFKFRDQNITVTASISMTMLQDSDTPELVLERLNAALNEAKMKGSNQSIFK
ncbi:diguanylate cyclase [Vibrio sp. JC009]|uniref:GGDEF domain-containing protein n=1 Tax=Vibrio sp. JC009 TaxID=2912314 RepID=UPI0023B0DF77|nr:GGDEF domain-containing protein [Vibrio sp. JC009]WED21197.1 diguanylate cyclase [Vibrio sp. JC009]